jgi:hypothetical protein
MKMERKKIRFSNLVIFGNNIGMDIGTDSGLTVDESDINKMFYDSHHEYILMNIRGILFWKDAIFLQHNGDGASKGIMVIPLKYVRYLGLKPKTQP